MNSSDREERLDFCGLTIAFDHQVLHPRPWTAAQSQWAAQLLTDAPAGPVLELCSGVGHIGLAAVMDSTRHLVMVDLSAEAKRFAHHNAVNNGLAQRVEFRLSTMEEALEPNEKFALIIADPPWVPSDQTSRFPADPLVAIDGGTDGLDVARTCVELINHHLAPNGTAVLQLGNREQVELIDRYAQQLGINAVTVQDIRSFPDGVIVTMARQG